MISVTKNSDASKHMKTLMSWREINDGSIQPMFLELEGDYTRFDNVYINMFVDDEDELHRPNLAALQDELNTFMFGTDGVMKHKFSAVPTKDWDIFIQCGFIA